MFSVIDIEKIKVNTQIQTLKEKILNEFCTTEYGEVLRYNQNAEKYSFSNPFFHAFIKMKIAVEKAAENDKSKKKNYDLFDSQKEKNYEIEIMDSIMVFMENKFENSFVSITSNTFDNNIKKTKYNEAFLPKRLKHKNKNIKK